MKSGIITSCLCVKYKMILLLLFLLKEVIREGSTIPKKPKGVVPILATLIRVGGSDICHAT